MNQVLPIIAAIAGVVGLVLFGVKVLEAGHAVEADGDRGGSEQTRRGGKTPMTPDVIVISIFVGLAVGGWLFYRHLKRKGDL